MISRRTFLAIAGLSLGSTFRPTVAREIDESSNQNNTSEQRLNTDPAVKLQSLTSSQQERLRAVSARIKALPPHRRDQFRASLNLWREMTPPQREKLRNRWRRFRSLPTEQQARLRRRYEHWKQLTPEQQKLLDLAIKRRQGS